MTEQTSPGRIRARARMTATKIHQGNSPQVLSGELPLGAKEPIKMDEPDGVIIELDYAQCVEMFGVDKADELFKGVEHG